jgi:predicted O-methyltransferase YrrM
VTSLLERIAQRLPGVRRLDAALRSRYTGSRRPERFPRGHYNSPLPGYDEVERRADSLFATDVDDVPGIDLRAEAQLALLREVEGQVADFDWPAAKREGVRYYRENPWFEIGDALSLYLMLRRSAPRRVVEVGSGFSSALMLDVNERFLEGAVHFTFVEPYPERLHTLLGDADRERCRIHEVPVQEVPLSTFEALESGDVLFIDSSHVSRIGSDVNHLFFEVLPRLAPGVLVEVHDVLWPFEYPKKWVLGGSAWNEAYLVRAFLQYNERFEIVLFNSYLAHRQRAALEAFAPEVLASPGGSLWLRVKPSG